MVEGLSNPHVYIALLHNVVLRFRTGGTGSPVYSIINTIILVLYSNNNDINDNGEIVQFFFFFYQRHAHGVKLHRSGLTVPFYFVGKMAFRKISDWRFRLPFYFISRPKGCNLGSAGGLLHTFFKGLMFKNRCLNRIFLRKKTYTHLNRKCAVVLWIKVLEGLVVYIQRICIKRILYTQ